MTPRRFLVFSAGGALALLVVVTLGPSGAAASDLTAEQIVERTLQRNAFGFENAIARITLTLTSKRGNERVRQIEIRSTQRGGLGRSLVRFHSPADVAGTGFLVLENEGRDDDQYLFLPALGKVKRITGSQRNQRFMGTDLTYADLESRNLRRSTSTRLPDAKIGGNPVFVLESVPKDPTDAQYGKTISYIHQTSFVPLKVEFFDTQLRPLKTLTVARLEKKDGSWVVMDSTIENLQEKTRTRMVVDHLDLTATLGDDQFTQEALKGG